jgi:hypothetical protein
MKLPFFLWCFLCLFAGTVSAQQNRHTISGYVYEKNSREQLIGATIYIPKISNGTTTNTYGFYSITLPKDSFEVVISLVGYRKQYYRVYLDKDVHLDIQLESASEISEVVINAERTERSSDNSRMSMIDIPVEQIKEIPAFMGEKDVLKVIQLMPGVQKGSEGNAGLYVRGGGPDQNLIILDDAPVYNAFHLFGFFSLFNGDALKSVELTKGGFPARYGGRLSSVIDMNMKEGDKQQFHGEGGIGLISSRLTLEGPLVKNKSSFLVSGRRTYIDALIAPFMPQDEKGGYYFYDLNAKVNYDFGPKNKVYMSGYFGRDKFYGRTNYSSTEKSEFGLFWGNGTGTLRWNHLYTNKLFSNTSLIYSKYAFNIYSDEKLNGETFNIRLYSGIRDFTLKHDFDYSVHPNHFIKAGIILQQHRFTPSGLTFKSSQPGDVNQDSEHTIDALESGIYVEDNMKLGSRTKINAGIRLSHFLVKGKSYINPEPRISANYSLKEDLSWKVSYAMMNQYIHLLSSTSIGLPTDLWVPTTNQVKPQRSEQVATGFAKDFLKSNLTLSVEGYYKKSSNVISYKEGASFLVIDVPGEDDQIEWEDNITQGQGWSYGMEFFLQRKKGKFSGWAGYTLSWTQLQFDELNLGKKYFARYDRRHDISLVGIYKIVEDVTFAATWVYGTGSAITLPRAEYVAPVHDPSQQPNNSQGDLVSDYGEKNSFRMAAYHRLDLSFRFHKQLKRAERTIELSVYNVYNRKNAYFYYIGTSDTSDKRVLKQISLFPILPSISWTYKF